MALSQQTLTATYTANGSTTIFPFAFKIFNTNQVKVIVDNVSTTSGFTVDFDPAVDGGSVIFNDAPDNGSSIIIFRSTDIVRVTDFITASALDANTLDYDLDYLTAIAQENADYGIKLGGDGKWNANNFEMVNVGYPTTSNSAISRSYLDTVLLDTGNLPSHTVSDNNKYLRVESNTPVWHTLNVVNELGYTPANKAGDTITGTLNTATINATNITTSGTIASTGNITAPTQTVGTNNTTVATTAYVNRATAGGGHTKLLQNPIHSSIGFAFAVNNQVFVSGASAIRVGKNNTVNLNGFVHLPFTNAWQIPNGTTITEIESNGSSIYVVLSNGWVYSWGYNGSGQLGHGDTNWRYTLTRVEYFVTNSISINKVWCNKEQYSGGNSYGLAFFRGTNGNLYGCGQNSSANLGIGNTTGTISTPTQVLNITNVVDLHCSCAAAGHTLAISSNNLKQVWAWGYNAQGQLGNGTTTDAPTPFVTYTDATNNIDKIIAASSNYFNGSAWSGTWSNSYILVNGTIKSVGHGGYGQLANGSTSNQSTWQTVSGTWSNIWSNGGYFTALFAINSTGDLFSCGYNGYGQLGLGNTSNYSTLTDTGMNNVVDVYCAQYSSYGPTIVKLSDGSMWGCGYNGSGTLALHDVNFAGTNSSFQRMNIPTHSPIAEVRLLQAINNRYDNCIFLLLEDGSLMACGHNSYGILANNDVSIGYATSAFNFCNLPYK